MAASLLDLALCLVDPSALTVGRLCAFDKFGVLASVVLQEFDNCFLFQS